MKITGTFKHYKTQMIDSKWFDSNDIYQMIEDLCDRNIQPLYDSNYRFQMIWFKGYDSNDRGFMWQEHDQRSSSQTPHSRGKRIDVVSFSLLLPLVVTLMLMMNLVKDEKRLLEKDEEIFVSQMSRYLFPLLFALFNIFYWSHYLNQVFTLSIIYFWIEHISSRHKKIMATVEK